MKHRVLLKMNIKTVDVINCISNFVNFQVLYIFNLFCPEMFDCPNFLLNADESF